MRSRTKQPGRERENPFLLSSCTGSSRRLLISPAHASGSSSHGSERILGEAPPRNSSLPSRRVACAALRSSLSEAQPRRAGQGALPAAREQPSREQLPGRLRISPTPGEGLRAGASEILRLGAGGGLQVGAQLVHVVQGLREERPDGVDLHQGQVIQLEREKKPQNLRP